MTRKPLLRIALTALLLMTTLRLQTTVIRRIVRSAMEQAGTEKTPRAHQTRPTNQRRITKGNLKDFGPAGARVTTATRRQ